LMIASLIFIAVALWGCGALLYALPASLLIRSLLATALVVAALLAMHAGFTGRWLNLAPFALGFAALFIWWSTILPLQNRDWDKVAARLPVITFAGNSATIENIRNFTWRSESDADQNWSKRTIDLNKIEAVDLFFSYWTGPSIAHLVVSFPIAGETPLAFSIEIRREKGEEYSPLAGFFKQYELAIIAAEETDIIRLRTDIWREDVRLYRTGISRMKAQRLFRAYATEIASLNAKPQFYHTIFSNCTTLAFRFARQIWPQLPLDWRVLVAGRAPELAYEIGVLDSRVPYADIQRLSAISAKAQALPAGADYSAVIRSGLPQPIIEP
jgi:hypothetical protein